MSAKQVSSDVITFTTQAKNIIDTYATINDRISVIYAKESNGCEYNKLISTNTNLQKFMEFSDEDGLYVLCSIEDNEENLSYILHKYQIINRMYAHISSTKIFA